MPTDEAVVRRRGAYPVVYRVHRMQQGGGYGDQERHPFAWGVLVYVDGQLARINSARGAGREWNDLDRVERWLRAQGFSYWWTRNDLEEVGVAIAAGDETSDRAPPPEVAGLPVQPRFAPGKFSLK